ncbi:MAG TPA: hypothetical protein VN911_02385 [Candidatus Acidoferrum sp.]|nr:hypothetical protein [Candidatus Acidoferrum sp.]
MGPLKKVLVHVAWSGLFISGLPGAVFASATQEAGVAGDSHGALIAKANEQPPVTELPGSALPGSALPDSRLPDSPGTVAGESKEAAPAQQQNGSGSQTSTAESAQKPAQNQSQTQPQKPVGTAAAEAPDTSGIAASQPAGVAVAPAKQHRVRTIVLRTGAIIGVAVAVGAVVALSAGTSSKPPGAH